jgi:hypothetical protein
MIDAPTNLTGEMQVEDDCRASESMFYGGCWRFFCFALSKRLRKVMTNEAIRGGVT